MIVDVCIINEIEIEKLMKLINLSEIVESFTINIANLSDLNKNEKKCITNDIL